MANPFKPRFPKTTGVYKHNQATWFDITGIAVIANGNVGIGTRTPAFKLDVNGSINSNANASVTGSITGGSIVKTGGTANQFLKADGSTDENKYVTSVLATRFVEVKTKNDNSYTLYGSWGNTVLNVGTTSRDHLTNSVAGTSSSLTTHNENHGVIMEFASGVALRKIVLYGYNAPNIDAYRVEYSDDNSLWTTMETFPQAIPQMESTFIFNLDKKITAKYWRWAIDKWTVRDANWNYYFYEMVAFE